MKNDTIQWHPAFDAALQIELAEDADNLTFEPEHLLGKKPLQMDELVIKKNTKKKIHKKLGHIFLGHNIIEYKSPDDTLSLNDFYKTYAYACLYQSNTEKVKEIAPEDITITFVCNHYPREMLQHIQDFNDITVEKYAQGIYHLIGDAFPMQLIITHELSREEYYWLYHLRNNLKAGPEIEDVARHYSPNKHSKLYQAVMNVIIRGNRKEMEAERDMCEALYELFEDELKERENKGRTEGRAEGKAEGKAEGRAEGRAEGKAEGRAEIIKELIETCAEFGITRTETLARLISRLSLPRDSAIKYMDCYWK